MKTRLRKLHNTKFFNLNDLIDENKKMMEKDTKFITELEKKLDEKLSKE
ncbi:FbpB family small basic protein [Bacillus sp. FJAT-49736]|nr:FbpB family small basic protein [Bacillus sp. FJAT-49736]MBS4174650.1 FbpB family small basic protein [Bacillus sp. FJAT-49736]